MQFKWLSGRPDAQNFRRTTWTSQQVIRGTTRLTSPELEFDFETFFHLFWSASTFKIDGFQHYFPPLFRVIVVHLKPSSKARNVYNSLPLFRGMSARCHTIKRYLCEVRSAMTTLINTPLYGGGLNVKCMVRSLTILWYIFSVVSIC